MQKAIWYKNAPALLPVVILLFLQVTERLSGVSEQAYLRQKKASSLLTDFPDGITRGKLSSRTGTEGRFNLYHIEIYTENYKRLLRVLDDNKSEIFRVLYLPAVKGAFLLNNSTREVTRLQNAALYRSLEFTGLTAADFMPRFYFNNFKPVEHSEQSTGLALYRPDRLYTVDIEPLGDKSVTLTWSDRYNNLFRTVKYKTGRLPVINNLSKTENTKAVMTMEFFTGADKNGKVEYLYVDRRNEINDAIFNLQYFHR